MQEKQISQVRSLKETVIDGGYCIGCGACAAVEDSPITIDLDHFGCFQAKVNFSIEKLEKNAKVLSVCPFSDQAYSEKEIGDKLYGEKAEYHDRIGHYLNTYAGYVAESDFRARGSSGGIAKWVQGELLKLGLVDAIIHVRQNQNTEVNQLQYSYSVASSVEEVRSTGAKAAYYPVEMSGILDYIKQNPKRYAIVGVPCFIKAIRLLSIHEPIFKDRVIFCIGIICGHLKSKHYADMMAWQRGIQPGSLLSIDFRKKMPSAKANEKGVQVTGVVDEKVISQSDIVQNFFGTNYGHGFFKYNACDYCDDVVAETADIAVGDAWLPQYVQDGRGTSIVVVRHPKIYQLVENGLASGKLILDSVTPEVVVKSQNAGLRHRREGLAYRLYLKDLNHEWRPKKRVQASKNKLSKQQRVIYELRLKMAVMSHVSFKKAMEVNNYLIFQENMEPLLTIYADAYRSLHRRLISFCKRRLMSIMKSLINLLD